MGEKKPPPPNALPGKVIQPKPTVTDRIIYLNTVITLARTASAPLERVKILLQCEKELVRAGRLEKPYSGIIDCAKRVVRHEGIFGLWRGNMASVLYHISHTWIHLFVRDWYNPYLGPSRSQSATVPFVFRHVMVGALSAATTGVFVYPIDYARTRLASDISMKSLGVQRQFFGMFDVFSQTVSKDGFRGLYRGFGTGCFGIFLYRTYYLSIFEFVHQTLLQKHLKHQDAFLIAYFCALTAGVAAHPVDTLRRRLVVTSGTTLGKRSYVYKGLKDCWKTVVTNEGYPPLMNGLAASAMAGTTGLLLMLICEELRKMAADQK